MKSPLIAATLVVLGTLPTLAQDYQKAGSELEVGDTATVPHLVPKGPEVPIALTVTAIEEGSMDDLKGFEIPADLRNARPIYVRYAYTNLSDEDLSAQQIGAFVAIDDRDQAQAPALAMSGGTFTKCTTPPAAGLTKGKSAEGCVMFMIHANGSLAAAAYQGHYRSEGSTNTEADFPIYYNPVKWTAPTSAAMPSSGKRVVQ
ncbi:hypothetical protein [Aureimonas glaciei]|uniref:Uncharacterized protein n=1 Tax=Aureimonas glaciei TaxID=1776957 RepID=A0A916XU30_9HYPH|nr:hypothetical protein [Aureimonas glaciei]GGD08410.1 hypothetical protein GCM10011335_09110 [Aureimonas glaciei]